LVGGPAQKVGVALGARRVSVGARVAWGPEVGGSGDVYAGAVAVWKNPGRTSAVAVGSKGPLAIGLFAGVPVGGLKSKRQFAVGLGVTVGVRGGVGVYVGGFSAHKVGPEFPWLKSCSWIANANPDCCTLAEISILGG
jgi:hypothetical protein